MDQRTEPIEQDIAAIRDSMTDKIGQIEDRIRTSVEETGDSIKRTVDLRYQVEERPWAMFGSAVVLGFVAGNLTSSPTHTGNTPAYRSQEDGYQSREWSQPLSGAKNGASQSTSSSAMAPGTTFFDDIKDQFGDELALVKTVAISSAVSFLRDMLRDTLPGLAKEFDRARSTEASRARHAPSAPVLSSPSLGRSVSTSERPIINNEAIPTNAANNI